MGTENINCCRRPQAQGKKELKTYKGTHQKLPNYKSSDDENNFGTYNQGKNNFEKNTNEASNPSYFDSIYANKNDYSSNQNFPKFSNFEIEPVSEPIYSNSNQLGYPSYQTNISQPQYENNNYLNIPQQNGLSQQQYIETLPTTKYIQSTQVYPTEINNIQTLPTKYISNEPVDYFTSGQVQLNNTSSNQYINAQPSEYNYTQNIDAVQYIDTKPISYTKTTQINPIQYVETPKIHNETQYITSNATTQYYEEKPQSYKISYESQNHGHYIEQPYIESSNHSNDIFQNNPSYEEQNYHTYIEGQNTHKYIENQNNVDYFKEPKQKVFYDIPQIDKRNLQKINEYKKMSPPLKYEKSDTSSTQYISSEPKIEQQIQYIEPQKQFEYTISNEKYESKPKQKLYIESKKPMYSEQRSQNLKIQKKYISKPKEYIEKEKEKEKEREEEKEKYIEKKIQNQQNENQFSQSEDDFPEIQKEPEELDLSEAEPHPHKYSEEERERDRERERERERDRERERERERNRERERDRKRERERGNKNEEKIFNRNNSKNRRKQVEYFDSEEDKDVSSLYDEIKEGKINKNNRKKERDFSPDGYKRFYPENDPFFKRPKGKKTYRVYNDDDESNNAIYEGEMVNGKKHGIGKYTTKEFVREGTWNNDKFTGWGRESRPNGEILEGRFVDGKVEGKGILRDSKGSSYIGDFVDSKKEGFGELDTEKAFYRGGFKNNKFHGRGRMKIKENDSEFEGVFRNGEIEKENVNYFCGGKPTALGVIDKRKEGTSCQGPAFISNFFSKMFN